jgi:IS5 family transposase
LEQTRILLQDTDQMPKTVFVDLGFRGADNPEVEIIHRCKLRTLTKSQKQQLRRIQAVAPAIGHLKHDHRRTGADSRGPRAMPSTRCYVQPATTCAD